MEINCTNCNENFSPQGKTASFIKQGKANKMELLMLDCPHCERTFPYKPSEVSKISKATINNESVNCPINNCQGYVSHVQTHDKDFYGCGTCANVWNNKNDLLLQISKT